MLKPSSARLVELSHRLGIHLKIGNCSVGRYVPGLKAALTCSLDQKVVPGIIGLIGSYRFHGFVGPLCRSIYVQFLLEPGTYCCPKITVRRRSLSK